MNDGTISMPIEARPNVTSPADLRREWKEKIADAWRSSIEAVIETGRLLVAAKKALPHGEFSTMIEQELPFGGRTAQRLMRIANDRRLTNPTRVSLLPNHWGTLYELTQLSDEAFERHVATGTIKPDMEREEAVRLRRPPKARADTAGRGKAQRSLAIASDVLTALNGTPWGITVEYEAIRNAKLSHEEQRAAVRMVKAGEAATIRQACNLLKARESIPESSALPSEVGEPIGAADRRSRAQRWRDAVAELVALKAEYEAWFESLPENLQSGPTGEALQAIIDLDLSELEAIEPPLGFGRD